MNNIDLKENFKRVKERINKAATRAGRDPQEIRLVAVTKTVPYERIKKAIVECGHFLFGENYIQEALQKIELSKEFNKIEWHFIGHLQTNKAKKAVGVFDLIHSVDSLKLANKLNKIASKLGITQPILLQVNVSGEGSKWGVLSDEAEKLAHEIIGLSNLDLKGLMTMPPFLDNPEELRPYFKKLRNLMEKINSSLTPQSPLTELSMGMSGDMEVAIEEGATMVRVGTALFGPRSY